MNTLGPLLGAIGGAVVGAFINWLVARQTKAEIAGQLSATVADHERRLNTVEPKVDNHAERLAAVEAVTRPRAQGVR